MRDRGIYGLVLAGGKSERMGVAKAELIYFDRPQWAYCANLLAPYCDKVFVSMEHADQISDVPTDMQLVDDHPGSGPFAGILSALKKYPDNTWLIMAVDMPGTDRAVMNRLIRFRDPDARISCFSDEQGNIEPLLSFWEASVREEAENFARHNQSPLEFIRKTNSHVIELDEKQFGKLKSINTPESRKQFIRKHSPGKDSYEEI